jgi:LmbE family N-acetylglucosaminyl deacetylase
MIALRAREEALAGVRAANEERAREVAALEAMFVRVRQATGVHSLEDMVAKIVNQVIQQRPHYFVHA